MSKTIIATNDTIRTIVDGQIKSLGLQADLNHIDVSGVTNMAHLFSSRRLVERAPHSRRVSCVGSKFNGDISRWDVCNVENMSRMFYQSYFNGDISRWDVSSVANMASMFEHSDFNGEISRWDISDVVKCDNALNNRWTSQSKHIGKIHFLCKAENSSLTLHPDAESAWDEHAPLAYGLGLSGPELGKAVWTSYQAQAAQAETLWNKHAVIPLSMGLRGIELGNAVWNSYQASMTHQAPQNVTQDLEDFDFSM